MGLLQGAPLHTPTQANGGWWWGRGEDSPRDTLPQGPPPGPDWPLEALSALKGARAVTRGPPFLGSQKMELWKAAGRPSTPLSFMQEEAEAQRQAVQMEAEVQGFSTCPLRLGAGSKLFVKSF